MIRDFSPQIDRVDITSMNRQRVVVGPVIIKSCLIFVTPAWNVIERTFGLLKKQWAILRSAFSFNVKTQVRINACCIHHNYVLDEQREQDAPLLNEVDVELATATTMCDDVSYDKVIKHVQASTAWTEFREDLALRMFADYQSRL